MTSRTDRPDHPIRRRLVRIARRTFLALLLLLLIFTSAVRLRSYFLCRRIQVVLSGLSQFEFDKTTEDQLVHTVPSLARSGPDHPDGASVERYYSVRISNESEIDWLWRLPTLSFFSPLSFESSNKWAAMDVPHKVAYCLGWRYISFGGGVTLRDGKVSRMSYGLETDVHLGWPASYFLAVHCEHAFWSRHPATFPVSSMADESPQYQIDGSERFLGVNFATDAPRTLTAHAFQLDLSCYWGIRGCRNVRDVAPLLWQDRENIRATTLARLQSYTPCPDRVLAGRARYFPDLNVALLEVVRVRREEISQEGNPTERITIDYRLKDILRGTPVGPWTFAPRLTIPLPGFDTEEMQNPIYPSNFKAGDTVLYFSGARFDSCRVVPATPSAISGIRDVEPAPKLKEEDVSKRLLPNM